MAAATVQKKAYDIVQQGIRELHNPENAEVDIVAIPGLGAPPLESWKSVDPKNDFNWLTDRDGLAKDFPRARILLYMYQSAWSGPLKVRQFMSNLAMTLLYALHEKRKNSPRRPIVFIGHSMGGLVIAKAVIYAESRRDVFGKMFEAITGSIFFGTPFDGAHNAAVASMFAQASELFGLDVANSSKLLDLMKPGDEGLRELKTEFMRLATRMSSKIELFCFYEETPTDWSKQVGLPFKVTLPKKYADFVTQESATALTGVDCAGLARPHRELVKFDGVKDTIYQVVRGRLKNIINAAPLIAKNRFNSTRGIDREVVKNVLSTLEGVQVDRKRKRLAQGVISSSWILQEQDYKQWFELSDPTIDCLWVLGPEGKGKLGAALAAVDHIEEFIRQEEAKNSGQAASLLAYYLCDATADGSSPEELLKSILRQLVYQQESLAPYAKQFLKPSRGKAQAGLSVENLWQSLQETLTDDIIGTVYFVINNLHSMDEEADSTKKLMNLIASELEPDSAIPSRRRVRWLFTSQNRHSIKRALGGPVVRVIDLDDGKYGDQVQNELRIHAQKKIAALGMEKGYNKALTYFAGSLIGRRAQNTQWIDITVIQLAELPTDARDLKIRSLLESTPQDLRSLLDRAWLSLLDPKDDRVEEMKEMLRTLILTYEEPTENDLAALTDLSNDHEQRAHLCGLVERCRPLLTFRKSGKGGDRIAFMNPIVKAHLLEHAERLLGLSVEEMKWQHGIMALRSFSHIMEFYNEEEPSKLEGIDHEPEEEAAPPYSLINDTAPTTDIQPQESTQPAVGPVGEAPDGGPEEEAPEELQFNYSSDEEESEYDYEEDHITEHMGPTMEPEISNYAIKHWLHHASKATPDIADSLSREEDFWKRDSVARRRWLKDYHDRTNAFESVSIEGLTGLHVAASVGFAQLVSALMKNGYAAERDINDTLFNTPLHLAAFLGRPNIVEVLLNSGANLDEGQQGGHSTPLAMAAFNGHCKVMVKLLNRGANPNSLSQEGPVINDAIGSGNMEAVRLLVEHGALLRHDADEDSDIPAPLALSALLSDLTMFTYLLDACADKIPPEEYSKALICSATAGRIEVTKRLLEFRHPQSAFQETLVAAAEEGNWDIIELVLETCGGLNCDEIFKEAAVGVEQQDRILSVIWNYTRGGISTETLNDSLYLATDNEKESTVKLLLGEFRANPNATGEDYGNALSAAAFDGTIDIVRALLDHGADVNSIHGWALQTAAAQGHLEVVELLVERGADVNARIDEAKFEPSTALQAACVVGKTAIVSHLLKNGADPNLGGGPDTCPIIAACQGGEAEILNMLIDAGAIIERIGGPALSTPLICAAATLYVDSTQRLLEMGANINAVDDFGDSALLVAASFGDAQLTAFLLEKGADITHSNKKGHNALRCAVDSGVAECIQVVVQGTTRVFTALNEAMNQGSFEVARVVRSVKLDQLLPPEEEGSEGEAGEAAPEQPPGDVPPEAQEPAVVVPAGVDLSEAPSWTPSGYQPPEPEPQTGASPAHAYQTLHSPPTYPSYSAAQSNPVQETPAFEPPATPVSPKPSPPPVHAAPFGTASPLTIADQLQQQTYQAYQSIQEANANQGYSSSQGYPSYNRPSRKPLGSASPGSPKQNDSGSQQPQDYTGYQSYQGYQSQTTYQTPPPSQGYQSPPSTQPSQDYSVRPLGLSQGYQSPSISQGYASPPVAQSYQQPASSQSPNPQASQSQSHRFPDYTHPAGQQDPNARYRYDSSW
ncbi:hypothetical protein DRE_02893 [Drechslerella stenobrocha 248]|uniref:Uncharacterized protein n=1 Tax=Drechslerella stenobrocha 248 TaxID=1043628 RepID=W7I696_9PEZI|nr:hypothetical protein DRE_02893 [Drechslerella stenobrocha 248]